MPRANKATIEETSLTGAFAQGINEGFRLTGYVTVFIKVAGIKRQITMPASEVPTYMADFFGGLRGEHYAEGVKIKLIAEGDTAPESATAEVDGIEEGEDPSIEDAEVVE